MHREDQLVATVLLLDPDDAAGGQLAEQRRVPGQHAQLPLGRPGDHHPGLTGPQESLDRDELDVHRCHARLLRRRKSRAV